METRIDPAPTDCAYLAGIIDGEGCIGIVKQKASKGRRFYYHQLRVIIVNTDKVLIDWLVSTFNMGRVSIQTSNPKWADRFTWAATDERAAELLRLSVTFLRLKKAQAEIAIAFQAEKCAKITSSKNAIVTDAMYQAREDAHHAIKVLNGSRHHRIDLIPKEMGESKRETRLTHCSRGHEFNEENTRIYIRDGSTRQQCRTCFRERQRQYRAEGRYK